MATSPTSVSLIWACALLPAPTPACAPDGPQPAAAVQGTDPVDVLGRWLKLYHQEKLDLTGSRRRLRGRGATMRKKDFITITTGLFPDQEPELWSHREELERLCDAVAELQTAKAVCGLLEVAAVGLDGKAHAIAMNTIVVQKIGERHVADLPADCRQHVIDAAQSTTTKTPIRAAALRALGSLRDELYRPHLESGLAERSAPLRIAAARGIARSKLRTAVAAVANQLANEPDATARIAMLDALTTIAVTHGAEVSERDRRHAVSAVLGTLGRFDWSVDLAALDYLRRMRSVDTVPALIKLLRTYAGDGAIRRDARRSRLVPFRAHELLVSLTGAVYPADQPTRWQSWWDGVRDTFTLAEPGPLTAKSDDDRKTGASSFFGVPVRGTRVLFVIDASGSMRDDWSDGDTKFDVARRELRKAVTSMPADSAFNLVAFGDRADTWRDRLMPATKGNKNGFYRHLDKMQTGRSTNVWAGLQAALEMETIELNARYATQADEIFVLSDGAPTIGEIVRPEQILQTVTETNRISRIRINTIYIEGGGGGRGGRGGGGGRGGRGGDERWMSGAELMKKLAEQNGGQFLQPKPPKQ